MLCHYKNTNTIFGYTDKMLRNIKIAFHYMDKEIQKNIITKIRPMPKCAEVVWSTHKKNHTV